MLKRKRRRRILVMAIMVLIVAFEIIIVFPPTVALTSTDNKPIILYYDYDNLPFQISQFPNIVNFTLRHGFNSLMLVVFTNHQAIFNRSTIEYFISYSESKGLTFVPSYYVRSTSDQIGNMSGLGWMNLDMERLTPANQHIFYDGIAGVVVSFVSVTSPYGQFVELHSPMNIVETYAASPWFWLMQLTYYHPGKICSIGVWLLHSQQEYNAEKDYCLKYTDGVMVFDYYNLLKSGFE